MGACCAAANPGWYAEHQISNTMPIYAPVPFLLFCPLSALSFCSFNVMRAVHERDTAAKRVFPLRIAIARHNLPYEAGRAPDRAEPYFGLSKRPIISCRESNASPRFLSSSDAVQVCANKDKGKLVHPNESQERSRHHPFETARLDSSCLAGWSGFTSHQVQLACGCKSLFGALRPFGEKQRGQAHIMGICCATPAEDGTRNIGSGNTMWIYAPVPFPLPPFRFLDTALTVGLHPRLPSATPPGSKSKGAN